MLNKIYLVLLGATVLVMAFFTYYSWSWLQSIGSPLAVVENYEFWSNGSWVFLWISTLTLLIAGNIVLWIHRRSWSMWLAAGYFAVFILIRGFWLDSLFDAFKAS